MISLVVISWPVRGDRSSASFLAGAPACTFDLAGAFSCGLAVAKVFAPVLFEPATGFGFASLRAITGDDVAGRASFDGASNKRPCSAARVVSNFKFAASDGSLPDGVARVFI